MRLPFKSAAITAVGEAPVTYEPPATNVPCQSLAPPVMSTIAPDDPLLKLDNVVLLPHMGSATVETRNANLPAASAASALPVPAPAAAAESKTEAKDEGAKEPAKEAAPTKPETTAAATPSSAVFPTAVSSKYSKESAGKARMHTCLDQYHANKANNANGGLKWIQKGGGYYSECTKKLKGAA